MSLTKGESLSLFKRNGGLIIAIALVWTWVHTLFWSESSSHVAYNSVLFGIDADWLVSVAMSTVALVALAVASARGTSALLTRLPLLTGVLMLVGVALLVVGDAVLSDGLRVAGCALTGLGSGTFMFAIGRAMVGLGNLEIILSVFAGLAISAALCTAFDAMEGWLINFFLFVIPVAVFPLLRGMAATRESDKAAEAFSDATRAELRTLVPVVLVSALTVGLSFGIQGGFGGQGAVMTIGEGAIEVNRYFINLVIYAIALVVLLILGTKYLKSLVVLVIGAGALLVANSILGAGMSQIAHIASLSLFTSLLWSLCGVCASLRRDARVFAAGIALYQVGQIVGALLYSAMGLSGQSLPESVSLVTAFVLLTVGAILLANANRFSGDSGQSQPTNDAKQQALAIASEYGLTEREAEIFSLMADGLDVEDISSQLFITQGTVRTHIKRIYAKLGVHSKKEALALVKTE